jgi:signal transduction histidine kinase/ActR/RegA family two-component response regulator
MGFGSAPDQQGSAMLLLSRGAYAVLLLAGLATLFLAVGSKSAEHWVRHTLETRSDARLLIRHLQSAVIRERGFLLTGEDDYLGSDFAKLLASFSEKLMRLKRNVADNPEQVGRLAEVEPKIGRLQETLSKTIALTRDGRQDQAVALVRSSHVQELLEELSDRLDQFVAVEDGLLAGRQTSAATLQNALLLLIGLSLALAAGLSLALGRSTRAFMQSLQARAADLEGEMQRRHETEATLRQAQKMEAIGQLTGGVAHDFNNLLTVIMGNLDTMKRSLVSLKDRAPAEIADRFPRLIDMGLQAAHSGAKLTHRLLAFARRQPLEPSRIDCNRLVSDMSDLLRRTLGETVNLETVLGGGLWPIFVDPNHLESALLNLALNAQHAMPNGGHMTIETANTYLDQAYVNRFGDIESGQYVLISVADTGTGIPPEILDRVFDPFFTTKPAEAGSGLGLAMVHGFVKQSGGHVRIYSELGYGTTVKMYFPRLEESREVAASPPGVATASAQPVERASNGETILVVEDNDGVRDYARSVLTELGYTVREASNAKEALSIVESGEPIDLLFTDVVLPGGVSGRQLSDQVAQSHPDLPVLFTTGYTPNAIVHHGRLDPGVSLISKPYTRQDLAAKVSEVLRSSARRRR